VACLLVALLPAVYLSRGHASLEQGLSVRFAGSIRVEANVQGLPQSVPRPRAGLPLRPHRPSSSVHEESPVLSKMQPEMAVIGFFFGSGIVATLAVLFSFLRSQQSANGKSRLLWVTASVDASKGFATKNADTEHALDDAEAGDQTDEFDDDLDEEDQEDAEAVAAEERWAKDQFLRPAAQPETVPTVADSDPAVASQWHPTKNGSREAAATPMDHPGAVWWKCAAGPHHEWEASPADRAAMGAGCPFCGDVGSAPQRHHVVEDFLPRAQQLRDVFDARFLNTSGLSPKRFCWDFWHVPDQYSFHRTVAEEYFADLSDLGQAEGEWEALKAELLDYGARRLGCSAITPLWLSYYCDGDEQAWHCDVPHGAYAFVLSLTNWDDRRFSGGETLLLRDTTLSHWSRFFDLQRDDARHPAQAGLNFPDLVESIPPRFNQLLVFDGRIPHGVRRVTGTRDPRAGRLVIHGWFASPEPFCDGPLSPFAP